MFNHVQFKENTMKFKLSSLVLAAGLALALPSHAQSEASAASALSVLPLASVVVGASAVAGSVLAVPLVFSTSGAVLVVKSVEASARGTVYVLERASDGAQASVEIAGGSVAGASLVAGTVVTVSAIGTGIVLSAAGEAIAFLPNALGRALLHNERVTF
jgi:hypothetical protein